MDHAVFPAQLELLVMQSAAQNGNAGLFFFLSMLVLWVQALPGRALHGSSFLFSLLALCVESLKPTVHMISFCSGFRAGFC